jgi:hypothetical protein
VNSMGFVALGLLILWVPALWALVVAVITPGDLVVPTVVWVSVVLVGRVAARQAEALRIVLALLVVAATSMVLFGLFRAHWLELLSVASGCTIAASLHTRPESGRDGGAIKRDRVVVAVLISALFGAFVAAWAWLPPNHASLFGFIVVPIVVLLGISSRILRRRA